MPEKLAEDDEPTLTKKIEIAHLGATPHGPAGDGRFAVRGNIFSYADIEPFSIMPSGEEGAVTRCAIRLKTGETVLVSEDVYPQFTEWLDEQAAGEAAGDPQPAEANFMICRAIEKRRLLQFSYDDLTRIVEPHLFGRKTSGNDVLSGWLVEGYTESDRDPYWRNYAVEKMDFILMLEETFDAAREGYNPEDQTMEEIYCRL